MPADHILTYALAMRGGVEAALGRMLQGWLDQGRRVTLVLGDDDGQFQGGVPHGVDMVTLGHQRYGGLCTALPGLIEQARPDVIFCPGNHYTAMAAWTRLRLAGACPPIVAKMSNAVDRGDQAGWMAWGQRQWLAGHRHFLDALVAMTPRPRARRKGDRAVGRGDPQSAQRAARFRVQSTAGAGPPHPGRRAAGAAEALGPADHRDDPFARGYRADHPGRG
ncbi:hypothetical protein P0F65_17115 [Sphingomonas sp. I4]